MTNEQHIRIQDTTENIAQLQRSILFSFLMYNIQSTYGTPAEPESLSAFVAALPADDVEKVIPSDVVKLHLGFLGDVPDASTDQSESEINQRTAGIIAIGVIVDSLRDNGSERLVQAGLWESYVGENGQPNYRLTMKLLRAAGKLPPPPPDATPS